MDMIKLDDLKAYRDNRIASGDSDFDEMDRLSAFIATVETIEPKRGEWIDEADKYDASFDMHDYRCSNCNSYADEYIGGHEWYTMYKPNYCPYCGCRMKGADDE